MRLDRRPLLDTALDAELFVDRERELDRVLRALDLELNVAIGGPEGSGRTSMLRRIVYRLRSSDRQVVFVGGSGAERAEDLLQRVLLRVSHSLDVQAESSASRGYDLLAAWRR